MMRILSTGPKPLDMRTIKPKPKVGDTFYSSREWLELLVRLKIERFGSVDAARCEDPACEVPGRRSGRVYGDHVIELRDDPRLALDRCNVLFRCPGCHTRKTVAARAGAWRWRPGNVLLRCPSCHMRKTVAARAARAPCLDAPKMDIVNLLFRDASLTGHGRDQLLRKRRFRAIDGDLAKSPVDRGNPILVGCSRPHWPRRKSHFLKDVLKF
jgi:hypothetical protein